MDEWGIVVKIEKEDGENSWNELWREPLRPLL